MMADGGQKQMRNLQAGENIITVDPLTTIAKTVTVKKLVQHEASNYAITHLLLLSALEQKTSSGTLVSLMMKEITATPNHPVITEMGDKRIADVKEGEQILCLNKETGKYLPYIVWTKKEQANGKQKVYNIETSGGDTFIINEVMVLQKERKLD